MAWLPIIVLAVTIGAIFNPTDGSAEKKKLLFQRYDLLEIFIESFTSTLESHNILKISQDSDIRDDFRTLLEAHRDKKPKDLKHAVLGKIAEIIVECLEGSADMNYNMEVATQAMAIAFEDSVGEVDTKFIEQVENMVQVMMTNDIEDEREEEEEKAENAAAISAILQEQEIASQQEEQIGQTSTTTTTTTTTTTAAQSTNQNSLENEIQTSYSDSTQTGINQISEDIVDTQSTIDQYATTDNTQLDDNTEITDNSATSYSDSGTVNIGEQAQYTYTGSTNTGISTGSTDIYTQDSNTATQKESEETAIASESSYAENSHGATEQSAVTFGTDRRYSASQAQASTQQASQSISQTSQSASTSSELVSVNYQTIYSYIYSILSSASAFNYISSGIITSQDICSTVVSALTKYGVQSRIAQSLLAKGVSSIGTGTSISQAINSISSSVVSALQQSGTVSAGNEINMSQTIASEISSSLSILVSQRSEPKPVPSPIPLPRPVLISQPSPRLVVQPQIEKASAYSASKGVVSRQRTSQSYASSEVANVGQSNSLYSEVGVTTGSQFSSQSDQSLSAYSGTGVSSGISQYAAASSLSSAAVSKASSQLMSSAAANRISNLSNSLRSILSGDSVNFEAISSTLASVANEVSCNSELSQSEAVIEALFETVVALLQVISPSASNSNVAASSMAQSLVHVMG